MALREEPWEPKSIWRPDRHRGRWLGLLMAPVFLGLAALLIVGYQRTLTSVTLVADGQERGLRTHQTTVAAALREAGVNLFPEDVVEPALDERVFADEVIVVRRARPVSVDADGRVIQGRTQSTSTLEILAQLQVDVGAHDEVHVFVDEAAIEDGGGGEGSSIEALLP